MTSELVSNAALTPEALEKLFRAFSKTSREIERSHADLQARVAALRKELAEKDRRLEQKKKLEALGLMVAGVAHEFRNPLGSLSLYLDCLGDVLGRLPGREASEGKEILSKIETAIRHLNAVVEDMLIFTRAQGNGSELCELPRLIDEALLLLKGDLEGGGVETGIEVDGALGARGEEAVVSGNRDQTVRIFVNVLKNAIQAIRDVRRMGEGRIWIEVKPGRAPDGTPAHIEVAIHDNGPGVPADRLEKLFVPFYTEKQKGVGLGLYIVHSLMERQGGRVEIENREEGGLTIRLQFAIRSSPEGEMARREGGDGQG